MQVHMGSVTADSGNLISCLTYQSRAVSRPTEGDLENLVKHARERNRNLGVTGMLLYENGRYLQTLEGPPAGLQTVWSSICRDDRHRDIEVLTEHVVSNRLFSDWDLLLYSRDWRLDRANARRLDRIHLAAKRARVFFCHGGA